MYVYDADHPDTALSQLSGCVTTPPASWKSFGRGYARAYLNWNWPASSTHSRTSAEPGRIQATLTNSEIEEGGEEEG